MPPSPPKRGILDNENVRRSAGGRVFFALLSGSGLLVELAGGGEGGAGPARAVTNSRCRRRRRLSLTILPSANGACVYANPCSVGSGQMARPRQRRRLPLGDSPFFRSPSIGAPAFMHSTAASFRARLAILSFENNALISESLGTTSSAKWLEAQRFDLRRSKGPISFEERP